MKTLSRSFGFGLVLTLICLSPLHAQPRATAPSGTNPAAATPAATGQAPDDVTNKITDLVHAGKYAEAQQLTTGLLAAYPNDERLIKAKALIEKLLPPVGAATATPGSTQPTNNAAPAQPAANTSAEQLTGMDKVDYDALIELARQAQQNTDLAEQKKLLQQFMDQSNLFLQKHPGEMLLWQLRAASAISLDDPMAGYKAGQRLLTSDSNDPNVRRLLAQLKNKGWLDKHEIEAARLQALRDKYTFPVAYAHGLSRSYGHMTLNENDAIYVGSDETIRFSKNEIREMKVSCLPASPKNMCGLHIIPKDGRTFVFFAVTEDAVNNKTLNGDVCLSPSVLGNAVAERWQFVSTENNKGLKPPPERGAIGVSFTPPDGGGNGVVVKEAIPGGPAQQGGLKGGDTIISVGGKTVTSGAELSAEVGAHHPGDKLIIGYLRNGKQEEATVVVSGRQKLNYAQLGTNEEPK